MLFCVWILAKAHVRCLVLLADSVPAALCWLVTVSCHELLLCDPLLDSPSYTPPPISLSLSLRSTTATKAKISPITKGTWWLLEEWRSPSLFPRWLLQSLLVSASPSFNTTLPLHFIGLSKLQKFLWYKSGLPLILEFVCFFYWILRKLSQKSKKGVRNYKFGNCMSMLSVTYLIFFISSCYYYFCFHSKCAHVGIGVPIMLAYVYGVVPISLCRSGGCGVSAGNGKGVRIEFDDENEMNVGSGAAATGTFQRPRPLSLRTLN